MFRRSSGASMQLGAHVQRRAVGSRIACFDPRTGQHGWFTAELLQELDADAAIPPPVLARLERLGLLAESPVTASWVPSWHRRTLLLPERGVVWHPLASQRTAGGWAYAAHEVTGEDQALLQAIDGRRTLGELAEGRTLSALLGRLAPLTAIQALVLRPRAAAWRDPALEQLFSPPRPPNARAAHMTDDDGGTALSHWHQTAITDGATHFDDRETTVAHALAVPHPGLGGRPYGEALARALEARGALSSDTVVVEVGCGTGELAAAAHRHAARWIRVDLSPTLLAHQARTAPDTTGVLADATALPFAADSVPLLVSNEVIADLPAVPDTGAGPARTALERYDLAPLPPGTRYNTGAIALVEEVARVLAPGGTAWLSEFGGESEVPTETEQLDHPEVSIHFGHLVQVARELGLEAELLSLPEFLGLDTRAVQLSRPSYEALRALAQQDGRHLQARAWTPERLAEHWPERIGNLHWVTLDQEGPGPLASRFLALLLHKP